MVRIQLSSKIIRQLSFKKKKLELSTLQTVSVSGVFARYWQKHLTPNFLEKLKQWNSSIRNLLKNSQCKPFMQTKVYFNLYKLLFLHPVLTFPSKFYYWNLLKKNSVFNLRLNCSAQGLRLNLNSQMLKHNYISITPGLLLKKLFLKKNVKKKFFSKVLILRLIKKVLLVLNITSIKILVKGSPYHLPDLAHHLQKKLSSKITPPSNVSSKAVIEAQAAFIKIHSIFFKKLLFFGLKKTTKKGRVKRRIARKLLLTNTVID